MKRLKPNSGYYYKMALKLGWKNFVRSDKKPKYSDCTVCRSSNTYLFSKKPTGDYWICDNCGNHFIIQKTTL